jgi:DNA-binding CsgD family transcriptional regulator
MPARKFTDEQLRQWHREGLSCVEMARRAGCSHVAISNRMKRLGIDAGRPGPKPSVDVEKLAHMVVAGLSNAQIAAATGRTEGSVGVCLCHHGITRKNAGDWLAASPPADVPAEKPDDIPPHPFWTPERDVIVLRSGGTWQGIRDAAEYLGKSYVAVQARWHRLRVDA